MKTMLVCVLFLICNVFTLLICAITPYITRKTESFGVNIPEEKHSEPEVKRLRENYRNRILLFGGVLSAAVFLFALVKQSDWAIMLLPAGTILLIIIMYVFYWDGHKKMKELKDQNNWMTQKSQVVVVDMGFRNKKIMISPLWFMMNLLIILITAAIGVFLYEKIPDRIPMHWNINGNIDRWADKSYRTVLWAPFVQMFLTIIMGYSYWIIGKSKQVIDPTNPENSSEQNRIFRYRWSVFTVMSCFALNIMFGLIEFFSFGFIKSSWVIVALPLVFGAGVAIASIVLSITTGQGGNRLYLKKLKTVNGTESKVVSRDEDKFWKAGLFYYNPDDPSFIVEKRFGIGWTNNWARPISWVITIGLTLVIIGYVVISNVMAK